MALEFAHIRPAAALTLLSPAGRRRGTASLYQRISLRVPTTVAFGSCDLLLVPWAGHLDQLPPGTHVGALPGCDHVPMTDDPDAVAALIATAAHVSDRPA